MAMSAFCGPFCVKGRSESPITVVEISKEDWLVSSQVGQGFRCFVLTKKCKVDLMRVLLIPILLCVTSCAYSPPSDNRADWYATIERGGPTKHIPVSKNPAIICLEIQARYREPLFGVEGFGGSGEEIQYWANLEGQGPVYRDPEVYRNGGGLSWKARHRGTITVDRSKKLVVIDLNRIVSDLGEPEKLEPSGVNGSFRIREWRD
jgi:hypothetical protein